MATRKEKPGLAACEATSGRITRAQAAANRTISGVVLSGPQPVKTECKQAEKRKAKRDASDENVCANAVSSASQPKRRKVLNDSTNIMCANSFENRSAATKLQSRPSQKLAQISSRNKQCAKMVPKLVPLAVGGSSFVNNSNTAKETKKMDLLVQKDESTVLVKNKGAPSLQNIKRNRDGRFHTAFFDERNARDEPETADSKTGNSTCLGIVDIDNGHGNPQMCASYAAEIYTNLMASELMRRPRSNYMEALQQDITKRMRGILIDWLVEVSEEYKLVADTLYFTVYIIDQFLSRNCIQRQKLQLLGITSTLIASKYEEICAPSVEEFCSITDNTYTKAEVLERQVLSNLGFHLSVPTIRTFLRRFLRAAQASCIVRLAPNYITTISFNLYVLSSILRACLVGLWKRCCELKSCL